MAKPDREATTSSGERPLEELPQLPGPDLLAGGQLWESPRLASISGPSEVKLRLLRRPEGLVVHVTAATPELAERVVRDLFGPDQPFLIEMCG